MSDRNVAAEILALLALVNAPGGNQPSEAITADEVKQFIAGIAAPGSIEFEVDEDHCAVLVAIEEFNAAETGPRTASQSQAGSVVTEVVITNWILGGDLFFIFPPGTGRITLTADLVVGTTYAARAVGYRLPRRALRRLRSVGARFPS